ncbi:MAG: Allene oxide cyclase [Actinomycetota bacterium]|nr:Allene oxide cyclase [Actinomycetota bacterium]
MAVVVLALPAWLIVNHPGIAGAAKKSSATKHGSVRHTAARIHVIEHAVTDTVVPSGGTGDVTGNLLTFHNQVFNPTDTKPVGTDQGSCVRIVPGESYECSWTTTLAHGQLMVQGPFYDTKNSVLTITGGTGAFRRARGEMKLISRNGGKEYDFIFRLS